MNNLEKSYLEIKVTFLHIVILLIGVVLIGIFLFYMGYQAGKSATKNQDLTTEMTRAQGDSKEIRILDNNKKNKKQTPPQKKEQKPSITEEIKLHQQPQGKTQKTERTKPVPEKTITRSSYFSVQVGAFSSFANAKNYSEKFRKMGYPTEILSTARKNKKLFRVRVGNFKTRAEAQKEKNKLEKMEKKKFAITKSG